MNLLYRRNIMYPQQTYFRWLTKATKQAILGAFGQMDGWAVINATNHYLTQLAASGQAGKDKATALAGFINEDPMLVCSLPLTISITMPKRWIHGDGTAYIVTAIDCTNILSIECRAKQAVWRYASGSFFGSTVDYPMLDLRHNNTLQGIFTKYFRNGTFTNYTAEHVYKMEWPNGMYIDGNASGSPTSTSPDYRPGNLQIFKSNGNTINSDGRFSPLQCNLAYVDLRLSGGVKHYFVPCKHNGQCGMYDIEGMTWYGNANSSGSFTIPDISYTPSTP